MRKLLLRGAAAAGLVFTAAAAHATEFAGSWSVVSSDPNIIVSPINPTFDFTLTADDPATFFKREDIKILPLFNIFVDEQALKASEFTPADITLDFTFSAPTPTDGGELSGVTYGTQFILSQSLHLNWDPNDSVLSILDPNGETSVNYGVGSPRGLLDIYVNGGSFDGGLVGLGDSCKRGVCNGAKGELTVYGTFDWQRDPTAVSVPEPASWALMIGGFGLSGAMLRRRRTIAAAA